MERPSVKRKLRLMASGVDITKYQDHIVAAMVNAQLDSDLSDYYKLLATSYCQAGDFGKAQECINKFVSISIPEMGGAIKHKEESMAKELEDMEDWLLKIDTKSLPKPKGLRLKNGKTVKKRKSGGGLKE